jgi:branched-chain amino acid transport system substrate-binding protein
LFEEDVFMKKLRFALLLMVVLVAMFSGCVGEKPVEESYKVGVILPLTGQIASIAESMKNGMELAVEEINAAGGIGGRKVELVYADSKLDATEGVKVTRKLIEVDGVPVIIGGVASTITLAAVPVAEQSKVVMLSAASTNPKLSGKSQYFFRIVASDAKQGAVGAEFAYDRFGARRAAIIYENNDYGIGLREVFEQRFKELGGEVVAVESYESGASDFSTQISKVKAANPDFLYLPGYYKENALIVKTAKQNNLSVNMITSEAFENKDIFELAPDAVEGVYFTKPAPDMSTDNWQRFREAFKAKYNSEPTSYSDYAYDAVYIVTEAIDKGGYSGDAIREYLRTHSFPDRATGNISFDENGDLKVGGFSLWVVRNQSFEPAE